MAGAGVQQDDIFSPCSGVEERDSPDKTKKEEERRDR